MPSMLRDVPQPALVIGTIALVYGMVAALREAWLCDDAFISFRYAENLMNGFGLVYNVGERVEGYSNFLWTLWSAVGIALHLRLETWSIVWGVAFYGATIALLGWNRIRLGRWLGGASLMLPIAAVLAAAHLDWNIYATSGLETSLFTFLVTLGYVLAVDDALGVRGAAASGLALALAAMTRPDGILFVPIVGLFVLVNRRPALRSALAFLALFVIAWGPYVAWKLAYYGDYFPNTYYAKSANLAWYEQGWIYVRLYFTKYGALLLGVPLALVALAVPLRDAGEGGGRAWGRELALALALAVAYTVAVARVGGDFMFARLLIPATPFYLIVTELALARLGARWRLAEPVIGGLLLIALVALPNPIPPGPDGVRGVVNERQIYSAEVMRKVRAEGETIARYFNGLPVSVAYVGGQAALMYYAHPPVAIECQTGLTDSLIAHRPLARRGRVGHEKIAPIDYVLEQRRVNFTFHHYPGVVLALDRKIPLVSMAFDKIPLRILHWDPELLATLEHRGARLENFPRRLDDYIAKMPGYSDAKVREDYEKFRRFYFEWVGDPARETPFIARVGAPGAGRP